MDQCGFFQKRKFFTLYIPCVMNLIIIAFYIYSLSIDIWLKELKINKYNETIKSFGLWKVCWRNYKICWRTPDAVNYELGEFTGNKTAWLFAIQFIMVTAVLISGYGMIIVMTNIVYSNTHISICAYILFFSSLIFMIGGIIYFVSVINCMFEAIQFKWGISFAMIFLTTCSSLLVNSMLLIFCAPKFNKNDCLINTRNRRNDYNSRPFK